MYAILRFLMYLTDTDWRQQQRTHQTNYNLSGNNARIRSSKINLLELNSAPIDCVASRTRSRTPQSPQVHTQGVNNTLDSTLSSGYGSSSRKISFSNNNLSPSTPLSTHHPSTSKGSKG